MGGGSSKSSSSSTTKINQSDQRIAATDKAIVVAGGSDLSIESADAEVVEAALAEVFTFASGAGDTAGGLVGNALSLVEDANKRAIEAQSSVGELGALKEILKAGTAIALVAGGAWALTRLR